MRAQKEWRRSDPEEYRIASLRKLILGRLPRRAAKYGCADFDLEDMSEYEGDDGMAIKGRELAGIAAHIVRCAKHPVDYLFSLRNVPAKVLEPMKVYLRVKLAMGRLRDEIEANSAFSSNLLCSDEVPAYAVCEQTANRDDRKTKPAKPPPSFTWHMSPAKVYDFKTLTQTCGYDPRETSVYWIEKRASALRRKWKQHGQSMRGETLAPKPKTRPKLAPTTDANAAPKIKHFTPADIDYNSVWPPVKMPDGPPKMADAARKSMDEIKLQPKLEKDIIENGSATPEQDSCASEVPSVCFAQRGDDSGTKSDSFYKLSSRAFVCLQTIRPGTSRGQYGDDEGLPLNAPLSSTPRRSLEVLSGCSAERGGDRNIELSSEDLLEQTPNLAPYTLVTPETNFVHERAPP